MALSAFGLAAATASAPHTEASNETLEHARAVLREYASGNFARYGELLQQLGKLLLPQ